MLPTPAQGLTTTSIEVLTMAIAKSIKSRRSVRALMLLLRLNADRMNYTPLSHRGRRAARLIPLLRAIVEGC